ncbi:hypothetical protein EDB81DRAFT_883430 [Dactylonectria macrodidyma]|uniref:Uncharacterized protein n=1 Tax=Dactylonectria macrodidyma TaxID=307937 RepID=A0A9P9EWV1_9HYPO|nr:hypothetical protein EDB81DRAFT_883430 [Dactylonectria macrodidyma]
MARRPACGLKLNIKLLDPPSTLIGRILARRLDIIHEAFPRICNDTTSRPDAAETVETLRKHGVSVHVVSGDDDGAVRTSASKLSIPGDNVRSRSSPADKKDYIQTLLGTATDRKKPVVVFCDDGTNDAVALAQATIGRLNSYLHRIGAAESDICDCGQAAVTIEHFLFRCKKWTMQREAMFKCS